MIGLWLNVFCAIICGRALTSAILLPSYTYLPTDFSYDSIKNIIEELGFTYESHEVVTEDGYILTLNRMINPSFKDASDKGVPVLLVNGLCGHSDGWFVHPVPEMNIPVRWSLAGYDVWLGDQRGSVRSSRHLYLSKWDWKFWDFSFHESGKYDMPAFIDLIVEKTGHGKVVYSGLSDGGAMYYVFTATRPEYQEKLHGGILWSPVGQSPSLSSMPLLTWMPLTVVYRILHALWDSGTWPYLSKMIVEDILPMNQEARKAMFHFCKSLPYFLLEWLRFNSEGCELPPQDELCLQFATSFGGTSAKTVLHSIQLFKDGGRFQQYDYGLAGNLERYGTRTPPEYDMSKLAVFTALYYSNLDNYAPNTTVVPFAAKFSGPTYECQIDNVCHTFVLFDHRVGPWVEDATKVLEMMTERSMGKHFQIHAYPTYKCNVTGHLVV